MAGKNDKVKIAGHVTRFTAQMKKKDSELKSITTILVVTDPKLELLSQLGKDPASAEAALIAAREGGCAIEIPCREEEFVVRWRANKKVLSANSGARFRTIKYDRENNQAKIEWGEPYVHDVGMFYLENLCVEHFVEFEMQQKELDLDGSATAGEGEPVAEPAGAAAE